MSTRWRADSLIEEAARNALRWQARQSIAIAASIVFGLGLALTVAGDWRTLADDIATLDMKGRNVLVAQAADPARPAEISVASCEAVAALASVERAGAVVPLYTANVVQLGPHVPVVGVSSTLLDDLDQVDVVVGSSLGLPGGDLTLVIGDEPIAGRVGIPRPDAFGVNSVVAARIPPTSRWTRQCVIQLADREGVRDGMAQLAAQLHVSGGDIAIRPALNESFDVVHAFTDRATRWVAPAIGLLGFLLGAVLLAMRGSEIAAYRLSGTSRRDLVVLLAAEQALLAGVTVAFGSVGFLVALVLVPTMPLAVLLWPWVAGLTWVAGFGLVAVWATRRSPAALARER